MAPRKPRRSSYETYLNAYDRYAKNNIMESGPLSEIEFNSALKQARLESVKNPARQIAADQQLYSTAQQRAATHALKQLKKYHPIEAEQIISIYGENGKLSQKQLQENLEDIFQAANIKTRIKLRADNRNYEEWKKREEEFALGLALDAEELFSPPNGMKKRG